MKIGILGGSFNPPQNAHLSIGVSLVKNKILDKVIYVPNILNPIHEKKLVSSSDRYNMLKLMLEDYNYLEVSDFDIRNERQNYSYETLDEFKNIYEKNEIYLIIGSDNLKELDLWKNSEYLISTNKIIVIKRSNDDIKNIIKTNELLKKYEANFISFDKIKELYLSSTIIREKIEKKEEIVSLVPDKVYNYIKEKNLYEV